MECCFSWTSEPSREQTSNVQTAATWVQCFSSRHREEQMQRWPYFMYASNVLVRTVGPTSILFTHSLTHSLTHACMQTQDTKSNNSIKLFVYTRINNKESNKKALFSPHLQEKNESWRWAAKRTPTHIFHFCNFRFLPRVSAASTMSSAANQARQRRIAVLGARAVGKSVIY